MKIWIWVAVVVVVLVAAYFLLAGTSSPTPAPEDQAAETVGNADVTATVENVVEGEVESPAPVEKSN